MVAPDVQIEDGKGTILISSEEGETEGEPAVYQQTCRERFTACLFPYFYQPFFPLFVANNSKLLSDFGIRNGSRLQADDFLQDYTLLVNVVHW